MDEKQREPSFSAATTSPSSLSIPPAASGIVVVGADRGVSASVSPAAPQIDEREQVVVFHDLHVVDEHVAQNSGYVPHAADTSLSSLLIIVVTLAYLGL
jgi:hypothetical protein